MFLLPILLGLIFILTLSLKLLGGKIAWWIVITFGALFLVPIIVLITLEFISTTKMQKINYKKFVMESVKITLFCLITALIFKLSGASNNTLLIIFNMAVMSSAAAFSVEKRNLKHVTLAPIVIVISTVLGGVTGFYFPILAKVLTVLYASLAFYFSKTKNQKNVFVIGAIIFLILSAIPFNLKDGMRYMLDGIVVSIIFVIFNVLFGNVELGKSIESDKISNSGLISAVTGLSLTLGFVVGLLLQKYSHFSYLYWIPMTSLVIIQGSQGKTIQTSVKRIFSNTTGALLIVFLFNYVIPPVFMINFMMLTLFLFLIFALGFSYFLMTLFIELFVLGFTHLLGNYQNIIAIDRITMTFIGSVIVMLSALLVHFLYSKKSNAVK
ncbi:MAG: FUSC family protein [Coxiellaceae bacterium]|nr:FUSC family protein [Coxiellaceae bacterium]